MEDQKENLINNITSLLNRLMKQDSISYAEIGEVQENFKQLKILDKKYSAYFNMSTAIMRRIHKKQINEPSILQNVYTTFMNRKTEK